MKPEPEAREIGIHVSNGTVVATRGATVFDGNATLPEASYGGGNMTLYTYLHGTTTEYTGTHWVYYFADDPSNPWRFRIDNTFVHYYWPPGGELDFFAYMPYNSAGLALCHVSNIGYTVAGGPSFQCDLPVNKEDQDASKEFIYAFAPGVNYDTDAGWAKLNFQHPFAVIFLKLLRGHRNMTLNSITFNDIHKAGTFTYGNSRQWTPSDAANNDLVVPVNKSIPAGLNFGAMIDGPFIVMPQTFAEGKLYIDIETTWIGDAEVGNPTGHKTRMVEVSMPQWAPGTAYTYTLDLGDINEEVLFKVTVEAWDIREYHIPIDVE